MGWLCKDPAGTITFEGGLAHVPAFLAPPLMSLIEQLRRGMPPLSDEQAWKDCAAALPLRLIAGILELRANPPRPHSPPLELPREVAAQFHEAVLAKIRSTLNDPIPQFKGKTLRQLARSVKGRPDAISWLREQERILKSNPKLAELDMRPLWQEHALPFQGLETDPLR